MSFKKNKPIVKSFINTILESDKSLKTGDYIKTFIKDKQKKLKEIVNVIQKK